MRPFLVIYVAITNGFQHIRMVDDGIDMVEWVLSAATDKGATGTDIIIVDNQSSVVSMTNHGENIYLYCLIVLSLSTDEPTLISC